MLNAKAAYAECRKLVTTEFKNFIKGSIAQIKDDNKITFEIFVNFFEAFMGFYKYYESRYKN